MKFKFKIFKLQVEKQTGRRTKAQRSDNGFATNFWAEAVNTTAYLRNRCITKILGDKTPSQVWFRHPLNVQHLKIFGGTAVALKKSGTQKFEAKAETYIMVGHSQTAKAYRLLNVEIFCLNTY